MSELGVTCSIGLGVNKTVAKIASEREKPRGLTVVMPGTEAAFLAPLDVGAMSGVGPSTAATLAKMGVRTLGELARVPGEALERALGTTGPRLAERAAALERSVVAEAAAPAETKSVSNERTFAHDLTYESDVERAARSMACAVGRRLRRKGLAGRTVTLKLKYDARRTRTARRSLDSPTDDDRVIADVAAGLVGQLWEPGETVRLVGVGVSDFNDAPSQLSLFGATGTAGGGLGTEGRRDGASRDLSALGRVTDAVRDRFGEDAVGYGRDLRLWCRVSDTAPRHKGDF